MKSFRDWFTPGSLVAAMLVALLWAHRFPLASGVRQVAQALLVGLTFAGLWALTQGGADP